MIAKHQCIKVAAPHVGGCSALPMIILDLISFVQGWLLWFRADCTSNIYMFNGQEMASSGWNMTDGRCSLTRVREPRAEVEARLLTKLQNGEF